MQEADRVEGQARRLTSPFLPFERLRLQILRGFMVARQRFDPSGCLWRDIDLAGKPTLKDTQSQRDVH
jgi:hypothetical protein